MLTVAALGFGVGDARLLTGPRPPAPSLEYVCLIDSVRSMLWESKGQGRGVPPFVRSLPYFGRLVAWERLGLIEGRLASAWQSTRRSAQLGIQQNELGKGATRGRGHARVQSAVCTNVELRSCANYRSSRMIVCITWPK